MFLFLPRSLHAAAPNELDNLAQLVAIEPGAVAFTNIDDHAGTMRKVDPVHQIAALWTGRITDSVGLATH